MIKLILIMHTILILYFVTLEVENHLKSLCVMSCVDSYFSKDMQLSWIGAGVYLQDPYDPNFDLQVESIDRLKLPQTFRKLTSILKLNYVVNVCTFYSK